MNIVAFAFSLFAALFSGVQALLSVNASSWSPASVPSGVSGVLIMFSALLGLIGCGMALIRRERAPLLLSVGACAAAAAFFTGFQSALVWAGLYFIAAILARLDMNAVREDRIALAANAGDDAPRLPGMLRAIHGFLESPIDGQDMDGRFQILHDDGLQALESLVGVETGALVRRAFIFIEDGEFARADQYLEQALTQDPENSRAYLGKLMVELGVRTTEDLAGAPLFEQSRLFQRALKFASAEERVSLNGYIEAHNAYIERQREAEQAELEGRYRRALALRASADTPEDYQEITEILESLGSYKDAQTLSAEVQRDIEMKEKYEKAVAMLERATTPQDYDDLTAMLEELGSYRDTPSLVARVRMERRYMELLAIREHARTEDELEEIAEQLDTFGNYRDAMEVAADARRAAKELRRAARAAAARRAVIRRWGVRIFYAALLIAFLMLGGGRWIARLCGYVPASDTQPAEEQPLVAPIAPISDEPKPEAASKPASAEPVRAAAPAAPKAAPAVAPAPSGAQDRENVSKDDSAAVSVKREAVEPSPAPAPASASVEVLARPSVVSADSLKSQDIVSEEPKLTLTPMKISGNRVNLRGAPARNSPVLARMFRGDSVEAMENRIGTDGQMWYHVRTSSGAEGWVFGQYVRDDR